MSKLQDMPIMDRLHIGARLVVPAAETSSADPSIPTTSTEQPVTRSMFQWLTTFKRVRLNEDDRMTLPRGTKTWDVGKMFGHLMLPFPRLWIEWNNTRSDESGVFPTLWMGAMCESWKYARENGSKGPLSAAIQSGLIDDSMRENSWVITPMALHSGVVAVVPMLLIVDLDDQGVLEGVRGINGAAIHLRSLGVYDDSTSAHDTAEVVDLVWDALVAVGWMNCRNVSVRRHDRSGNIGGSKRKRMRNRARSLDFHTIHLPGVEYDSNGNVTGEHQERRLHQVRGHFKTFTPESPLMGQHVGTYWWGWQVRGNSDNGVVVSDYQVGAAS